MTNTMTPSTYNRRMFGKSILAGAFGLAASSLGASERIPFHILSDHQTPIRNQAKRGTCYVHSVVAAMEAAFKRAGYGNLDLSEEFANNLIWNFWLEPRSQIRVPAAVRENGFAMGEGGMADGVTHMMAQCGFAIPEEKALPYRPKALLSLNDHRWRMQYNVDSFNLNPEIFNPVALSKVKYYGVRSYQDLKPNNPRDFEEALLQGREIIWDFNLAGNRADWLWEYDGPANWSGHSMLIYGFDRSDESRPYFFVKNSWGEAGTYVSYEYVRRYGARATTITGVSPPRSWPELAYLGRWGLDIDCRKGHLDLYHLPGMSKTAFAAYERKDPVTGKLMEDRRLGTFFLDGDADQAFRVNGSIGPEGLRLNIDWSNPSASYSHTGGQEFTLRFSGEDRQVMKGRLLCGDEVGGPVVARRLTGENNFTYQ